MSHRRTGSFIQALIRSRPSGVKWTPLKGNSGPRGRRAATSHTVVPLGPWSNLADAAALDPAFASNLAGIHAMGGTIDAPGNVDYEGTTPAEVEAWRRCRSVEVDTGALSDDELAAIAAACRNLAAADDIMPGVRVFAAALADQVDQVTAEVVAALVTHAEVPRETVEAHRESA